MVGFWNLSSIFGTLFPFYLATFRFKYKIRAVSKITTPTKIVPINCKSVISKLPMVAFWVLVVELEVENGTKSFVSKINIERFPAADTAAIYTSPVSSVSN